MSHKPDPNKNVNLFIDSIPVTVPEGTTILEAARKANVNIPVLCDHPALGKRAVCRVCVVECDGRGKLLAACSQDVWEGVHVVTTNKKLNAIRKTIIDLILADHPQKCLGCSRNTKCELQTLAGIYNERGNKQRPFQNEIEDSHTEEQPPESSGMTLTRDMRKCVKCGRCVEACQKVQTAGAINTGHRSTHYEICTPYMQPLEEGPCVYCGLCADVCPVGAIVEYDQSKEVQNALNNGEQLVVTQITAAIATVMDKEFNLAEGTITNGKLVTALKMLGFGKVYDADIIAKLCTRETTDELNKRTEGKKFVPIITGCSPAVSNFVRAFYPDLIDHLSASNSPEQNFGKLVKVSHNETTGTNPEKITCVSIVPCTAKKYEAEASAQRFSKGEEKFRTVDMALTGKELARMIRMAGIEPGGLPETACDSMKVETGTDLQKPEKALTVYGLANARAILESIREGKCDTALVHIASCPEDLKSPQDCGNTAVS